MKRQMSARNGFGQNRPVMESPANQLRRINPAGRPSSPIDGALS